MFFFTVPCIGGFGWAWGAEEDYHGPFPTFAEAVADWKAAQ